MGKYLVFSVICYSDDNGKTWHESETASWEMEGNEDQKRFGESKILECSDGTLRMYNSWNEFGCIVYSESKDNGVTWGPIVKMPEFICATSSMQFNRDPYAENDSTYYMVWVNSKPIEGNFPMSRANETKFPNSVDIGFHLCYTVVNSLRTVFLYILYIFPTPKGGQLT